MATTNVPAGSESANAKATSTPRCDQVGNCTLVGVYSNRVDRRAPTVSLTSPRNAAVVLAGTPLTASYACADSGSGVAECSAPVASGAALPTGQPGDRSFSVSAVDRAGNVTTASVTWKVVAPLSGRILDSSNGAPIEGATVTVIPVDAGPETVVTTGADGAYGAIVALGSYRVRVTHPGHVSRWYGGSTAASAKTLTVDGTRAVTANFSLVAFATISGKVASDDGSPLAGATVTLSTAASTPLAERSTDDEGRWSAADLAPGTYRIQLTAAGHQSAWHGGASTKASSTTVEVGPGDTVDVGADGLLRLATVSGRVTDAADAAGLEGATVRLYATGATTYVTATTDADGRWSVLVRPGSYEVYVAKSGWSTRWWTPTGGVTSRSAASTVAATTTEPTTVDQALPPR